MWLNRSQRRESAAVSLWRVSGNNEKFVATESTGASVKEAGEQGGYLVKMCKRSTCTFERICVCVHLGRRKEGGGVEGVELM